MDNKYHPDELKFMQEFKIPQNNNQEKVLKRIYSLKFKQKNVSSKFIELKEKCENDYDKSFMKEWLQNSELIDHLSFRQKNNNVLWQKDDDIIILYGEYLPKTTYYKVLQSDFDVNFKEFWNKDVLNPIIDNFVNFVNNYTSTNNVTGKIEFVNIGDNVNITYFG